MEVSCVTIHRDVPGRHADRTGWNCWCAPIVLWVDDPRFEEFARHFDLGQ